MPLIAFLFLCTFLSWTFADVDYESDILPLFEDYCYDCHGPDKQKSGFRTDKRAHLLKGGDSGLAALIPGDPRGSYLMEVITSDDPEISMPPKGGKLFEDEIELLKEWVKQGAVWPGQMDDKIEEVTDHWAFQPIGKEGPAQVDDWPSDVFPIDNPIDLFVAERLQENSISPSPVADRTSLIRRLYLDLHGLQPGPDKVREFNEASSPKAYEQLVAELLDHPHYGERWARHWLDVVRSVF